MSANGCREHQGDFRAQNHGQQMFQHHSCCCLVALETGEFGLDPLLTGNDQGLNLVEGCNLQW